MKKDKRNKTNDDGEAIDDVKEVDVLVAEKSRSKKQLAIGVAAGIAALAVGASIGLLASGRLDLRAVLPSSTAKGAKSITDVAAKAIPSRPLCPS